MVISQYLDISWSNFFILITISKLFYYLFYLERGEVSVLFVVDPVGGLEHDVEVAVDEPAQGGVGLKHPGRRVHQEESVVQDLFQIGPMEGKREKN